MPRNIDATPDEWDDTDLLKVWDDCVAEYKASHFSKGFKYHSIAVNGGTIHESSIDLPEGDSVAEDDYEHATFEGSADIASKTSTNKGVASQNDASIAQEQTAASQAPSTSAILMPPLPPNMAEHTKALALSWYYAGYYAGVAEGYAKAWKEGDK